jgi:hypothetical protein
MALIRERLPEIDARLPDQRFTWLQLNINRLLENKPEGFEDIVHTPEPGGDNPYLVFIVDIGALGWEGNSGEPEALLVDYSADEGPRMGLFSKNSSDEPGEVQMRDVSDKAAADIGLLFSQL